MAASAAPYKLRIVGGLAGLNQYTRQEEPFWSKELRRLSNGRFEAEIVPFDRAGVPGTEMLRLLQLGVVPFGTTLMSSLTAQYPEYTAPDLAGLNPDIATLKSTLAAFRPYLEKSLRDQFGVEMLAVYVYPAQVVYCKKPLRGLADLSGRRIRVSSSTQADFVGALGGVAVLTDFAQIVPSLTAGNTECAITGTMSGNTLGLHTLTSHMHALPVTWGLALFGVNRAAWESLPPTCGRCCGTNCPGWRPPSGRSPSAKPLTAWPATGAATTAWAGARAAWCWCPCRRRTSAAAARSWRPPCCRAGCSAAVRAVPRCGTRPSAPCAPWSRSRRNEGSRFPAAHQGLCLGRGIGVHGSRGAGVCRPGVERPRRGAGRQRSPGHAFCCGCGGCAQPVPAGGGCAPGQHGRADGPVGHHDRLD
ncbi:putative transport protein [Acidovorax sp. NO-1]|nr:putative transport protein [Acidovorax sp. NO-1]